MTERLTPPIDFSKEGFDTLIKGPLAPIKYTLAEGGPWFDWAQDSADAGGMFAIKFDNGWIFDTKFGWRLS